MYDVIQGFYISDTPGSPSDKIVISRVTEEKCTISWKIPLEDGGDTVSHYIVERRETSRLNWVVMETECKTLSCVSTRLIKNNEYIFRVRGVNKFGPGVPLESEPVIARNAYSKLQRFPNFAIAKDKKNPKKCKNTKCYLVKCLFLEAEDFR